MDTSYYKYSINSKFEKGMSTYAHSSMWENTFVSNSYDVVTLNNNGEKSLTSYDCNLIVIFSELQFHWKNLTTEK